MTDQERQLQASLNAQRFSEEVARQIRQKEVVLAFRGLFAALFGPDVPDAEQQRQAQQRATFGDR